MNEARNFIKNKKIAIDKLENAKENDFVDEKIIKILDLINNSDNYYTTSSCSGRIVLLEIPLIGDKREAKFLGKWHNTITFGDLINGLNRALKGQIWLLAQSPILHLGTNSIDSADKMVNLAISSGFKNSGIKSLKKKYIVEICSTERLDSPIGHNGKVFCNDDHLNLLVDISNEIYNKSSLKLKKLYKNMQSFKYL